MHTKVKSFRERNPLIIGAVSLALIAIVTVGALNYQRLPFISGGKTYSAYFEEAGALETGAPVQVSGYRAGRVLQSAPNLTQPLAPNREGAG